MKAENLHNAVAVGRPCKVEYLHITLVVGGPFRSRLAYLHIAVALGDPFGGRVLNYHVVWKILYERIMNFSLKARQATLHITVAKGPEASVSLAFP